MAESEVESILREIRERVLSQQRTSTGSTPTRSPMTNGGNGAVDSAALQQVSTDANETPFAENLSLIESYLSTSARAWDRLPPLVSNRSGLIARVELWLKRLLKRGTHWFTWEQVNFNASVHQAIRDLLPALAAHEAELRRQRDEAEARKAELERYQTELRELSEQLRDQLSDLQTEIDAQRRAAEAQRDQVAAQAALFGQLVNEVREGNQRLQDEQRVCFKQLALETSEAAVLEDRARRKTETLLEEMQRRVARLEKKDEA